MWNLNAKNDWVHADMSILKIVLMSEVLSESHLYEKCVCASDLSTGVGNADFSHNESSKSRDDGRVVIRVDGDND